MCRARSIGFDAPGSAVLLGKTFFFLLVTESDHCLVPENLSQIPSGGAVRLNECHVAGSFVASKMHCGRRRVK